MELTTAQRAARRVKKINNRIAKELPLFSGTHAIDQFLTTHEEQVKAVTTWDEINAAYFSNMDQCDNEMLQTAKGYREEISKLVTPSELEKHDKFLLQKQANYRAYQRPEYIADYWHEILRGIR